jgi:hypothetical protein
MSFVEFLFQANNSLYTGAITLMLFIAVLEGAMSLIGVAISDMLDPLIPDFELNISGSDNVFALSRFFAWMRIKKVPILMLVIIFLASFSIIGLFLQGLLLNLTGVLWSQYIILFPALTFSIYSVRICGGFISIVLPKDETSSISEDDLVGHIATITLGSASINSPAEAKTKDKHGQTHYLMIEPDEENIQFHQGEDILILGKVKYYFYGTNKLHDKLK